MTWGIARRRALTAGLDGDLYGIDERDGIDVRNKQAFPLVRRLGDNTSSSHPQIRSSKEG